MADDTEGTGQGDGAAGDSSAASKTEGAGSAPASKRTESRKRAPAVRDGVSDTDPENDLKTDDPSEGVQVAPGVSAEEFNERQRQRRERQRETF